ncbi:DUF5652 family protein [Paenibacillus wynnii]|uniref:DUF5652 domain-containing protein n=1 Tax=Paenibacillus wynnii TaxID=268407 RepID=A0A098MHB5_9BACL|nr:DUF5652 family protein [Paenibacillus wynnii]KGE20942.1 hypothetical protein PWYN_01925 [Paenibacillus wynnii]
MNELREIPIVFIFLIVLAAMLQGTCLFRNARKRGKRAWFWGLWGVTTIPMPSVVYLLVVVLPDLRRKGIEG